VRRFLLFTVVLMLLSAVLAGCGEEKKSGTERFLDSVDRFLNNVDTQVSKASETFDSLARNLKEGGELTRALIDTTRDTLKTEGKKISELIKAAGEDISNASSMKGTSVYDKYIEIQNKILDNAASLSKMVADATKQLTNAMDALMKGTAPDTTRLSRTAEEWSRNFDRIQEDINDLIDQASKLKES
jgi:ABC-type transporter Mla subunit MlaD